MHHSTYHSQTKQKLKLELNCSILHIICIRRTINLIKDVIRQVDCSFACIDTLSKAKLPAFQKLLKHRNEIHGHNWNLALHTHTIHHTSTSTKVQIILKELAKITKTNCHSLVPTFYNSTWETVFILIQIESQNTSTTKSS